MNYFLHRTHSRHGAPNYTGSLENQLISAMCFIRGQCYIFLFQAGLDVMLSVPRRANDAMYVNMLHGYDVSPLFCSDKLG